MSNTAIMGKAVATAEQMANYVLSVNPNPKTEVPILTLAKLFLLAGEVEGVRGDLEFARSCHETGNFAFKGTVTPDQKNFCGHGTVSATVKGSVFPDEFYSVLVQCQHAKAYATAAPLNYTCLDDRYKWVKLGSAPNMEDMGGKWAVPGYEPAKYASLEAARAANDSYGDKIVKIMNKILAMPTEMNTPVVTPEPEPEVPVQVLPLAGKKICLDAGHYAKYNRSPGVPSYYESEVMWRFHLILKAELEKLGAKVITTRATQNGDLALKSRGMRSEGCDLFLSLHSNAVGSHMNETVDYVAVYHLTEDAKATCDEVSEEVAKVLAPVIAGTMGVSQGYQILTRKSSNDRNGDGVLNDNYYGVLHGARLVDVPGLILEHSFHTNTRATKWLMDNSNLEKLAAVEAKAVAEYFAGQVVTVPYCIRIVDVPIGDVLNIRKEPDHKSAQTGSLAYNDPNRYTIVEERNGWGKLKSGIGWINLKYTVKV